MFGVYVLNAALRFAVYLPVLELSHGIVDRLVDSRHWMAWLVEGLSHLFSLDFILHSPVKPLSLVGELAQLLAKFRVYELPHKLQIGVDAK